jgi:septal ring-binding cell division protein DamX
VILIDEAHAMPEETLEQVRLLSNLESNRHKLLQIVLFGQPELDEILNKLSMRQLKDRITHSFRMRPLSETEVGKYLSFRMRAAGYRGPDIFNARAVKMIAVAASGLTRRVNILADKAMLSAFTESKHFVSPREVRAAIRDSDFGRLLNDRPHKPFLVIAATTLLVGLALGGGLHWFFTRQPEGEAVSKFQVPRRELSAAVAPTSPQPSTVQVQPGPVVSAPPGPETAALLTEEKVASAQGASTSKAPDTVPETVSRLDPGAATRLAAYRIGNNKLLRERIEATRMRLEREPDESFSIELFSTENLDPGRVERFLQRARSLVSLDDVYVLPQSSGGKQKIRVTFGGYPDRNAAALAAEQLPPKYRQAFQTELRSFAELRAAI